MATTGNDSNTTTQAQNPATPWLTLSKAGITAADGDTIRVAAGSYEENAAGHNNFYSTKAMTWVAEGVVIVSGNATGTVVLDYRGTGQTEFQGFTFNSVNKNYIVSVASAAGGAVKLTNCNLVGNTIATDTAIKLISANNDLIISGGTINLTTAGHFLQSTTDGNDGIVDSLVGTITFNGVAKSFAAWGSNSNLALTNNNIILSAGTQNPGSFTYIGTAGKSGIYTATGNTVTSSALTVHNPISILSGAWVVSIISNNLTFSNSSQTMAVIKITNQTSPEISENVIETNAAGVDHLQINSTGIASGVAIVDNNIFKNRSVTGHIITIGSESSGAGDNNLDGVNITNNTFYGCFYYNPGLATCSNHAIHVGFNKNGLIQNNIIYGGGYGIVLEGNGMIFSSGGIYNNILINCVGAAGIRLKGVQNVPIYNNTIYADPTLDLTSYIGLSMTDQTSGESSSVIFKNNIINILDGKYVVYSDVNSAAGLIADYNLYWNNLGLGIDFQIGNSIYNSFSDYLVYGQDTHSINLEPLFINKSINDFHLQSTSLAINAGTDVGLTSDYIGTSIPQGSAPDIGAYEYLLPSSAPTIETPDVLSSSSIRWNFTDNANNEDGFKIYDNTDTLVASSATTDLNYIDETGLLENTQYTGRYAVAYNAAGESSHSSSASSVYTLVDTPTNLSVSLGSNAASLIVDGFPNDTSGQSGYYFSSSNGENSGWIQTNSWTVTGLSCGEEYTYTAKYRNGDGVETSEISTTMPMGRCATSGSHPKSKNISTPTVVKLTLPTPTTDPTTCLPGQKYNTETGKPCTTYNTPTPSNTTCNITLTLRQGYRGEQVKCLQSKLNLTQDGIFGPLTKNAVILFQQNHNLVPDGVVGPKTRGEINK